MYWISERHKTRRGSRFYLTFSSFDWLVPHYSWHAFCSFSMLIYFSSYASNSSYSFGGFLARDRKKSPSLKPCEKALVKISEATKGISNEAQVNCCMNSHRDSYGFYFKLNRLRGEWVPFRIRKVT